PAGPLALHAVPARRSSDLAACRQVVGAPDGVPPGLVPGGGGRRARALEPHVEVDDGLEGAQLEAPAAEQVVAGPGDLVAVRVPADRKSTRLNSSHVKISYA